MTDEQGSAPLNLDPLAKFAGSVEVEGVTYKVRSITGRALKIARRLSTKEASPDMLVDAVASVVPDMPADVLESLDVEQLGKILRVASRPVAAVEAAAPKE